MRFMMLMIPQGDENAAPGTMPSADAVAAMTKSNEALQEARMLLAPDVQKAAEGFAQLQGMHARKETT